MYFASWSEFFAMGGHAPFVWASYGLMAMSLAALIVGSRLSQRRWLRLQHRRRRIAQHHAASARGQASVVNPSTLTSPQEH